MNDNILNPASPPMPGIQYDANQLNPSQNNQPPTENANQANNGDNSSAGPSGGGPSGNGPPDNGPPGGDPPPNGNPGGPPAGPPLQRGIYNPFANIPDENKLSFEDIRFNAKYDGSSEKNVLEDFIRQARQAWDMCIKFLFYPLLSTA